MRRGLAPALVALALPRRRSARGGAGAPGDVAIADEGNWLGSSGRVLRLPGGGAASLLAGGAPLSDPWAVAVAPDGALLVADEGAEAVFSIGSSGTVATVVDGDGLQDPVGIALAPDGKAYVSDRQRDEVLRLDLATGALSHVADLDDATGLAMDDAGKLLVTDGIALRRIDPGTGAITTVAAGAPLDDPRDVAVALDGTLYVAGDRQVVRVDPASGAQSVLAAGAPLDDPRAIDIEPRRRPRRGRRPVRRGRGHPCRPRDRGRSRLLASGGAFRVPAGLGVVGGAGVDPTGGGNGDPDGPAAPARSSRSGDPGPRGSGRPRRAGRARCPGVLPAAAGITVTLPDGKIVTLPPGVTPATSGILGVDFAAPAVPPQAPASARRASAPPAAAARSPPSGSARAIT